MSVTANQIKAARGLLDWTQDDLAKESGLQIGQVRRFENGGSQTIEVLDALTQAFEHQGIEFIHEGVRKSQRNIRTLKGQLGFWDFYDDVYHTVKAQGGEVLVSYAEESLFWNWLGDKRIEHQKRMEKLNNFTQKIIVKEGPRQRLASYQTTSYRYVSEENFAGIPFYVYGTKLAIIDFEPDDVTVFILDHPRIASAYARMFHTMWEICEE